jgi:anti-sigma B factor antagonist
MTDDDAALTLRLEHVGNELVVRLGGEMDLYTAPRLRDCFDGHLTQPMRSGRVIVDLEDLDFIDSTGLDALVRARDRVLAYGAELVLRSPSHRVYRLLELTGLDRLFTVEGGIPSA